MKGTCMKERKMYHITCLNSISLYITAHTVCRQKSYIFSIKGTVQPDLKDLKGTCSDGRALEST
jgi:hypothetical protein